VYIIEITLRRGEGKLLEATQRKFWGVEVRNVGVVQDCAAHATAWSWCMLVGGEPAFVNLSPNYF